MMKLLPALLILVTITIAFSGALTFAVLVGFDCWEQGRGASMQASELNILGCTRKQQPKSIFPVRIITEYISMTASQSEPKLLQTVSEKICLNYNL